VRSFKDEVGRVRRWEGGKVRKRQTKDDGRWMMDEKEGGKVGRWEKGKKQVKGQRRENSRRRMREDG